MYTNDLRGTLQQSSMQQQLQQHPSGEAASVIVPLTWVLSKSPRGPRGCTLCAMWTSSLPFDQLGDRPSSLVREGHALTPAEPKAMSARMPLQGE